LTIKIFYKDKLEGITKAFDSNIIRLHKQQVLFADLLVPISVEAGQLIINQLEPTISKVRWIVGCRAGAPLILIKDDPEHKGLGVRDYGAEGGRTGGHAALAQAAEAQGLPAKTFPGRKAGHRSLNEHRQLAAIFKRKKENCVMIAI